MTVDTGNLHSGYRGMAQGAGPDCPVAVNCSNDVTGMTAGAGSDSGYPIMILNQVIFVSTQIRGMACGTV